MAKRKTAKQVAAARRNIKKAQAASARKRRGTGKSKSKRGSSGRRRLAFAGGVAAGAGIGYLAYRNRKRLSKWARGDHQTGKAGKGNPRKVTSHKPPQARGTKPTQPSNGAKPKPSGYSAQRLFDELDKNDAWLEGTRHKKNGTITNAAAEEHYQRSKKIWAQHG